MQAKAKAKLKTVGFCREPTVLAIGWLEGVCSSEWINVRQVLRGKVTADAGIRGTLSLHFPGLRWFGNERLITGNLSPFPALSLIHSLWSSRARGAARLCLPSRDFSSSISGVSAMDQGDWLVAFRGDPMPEPSTQLPN